MDGQTNRQRRGRLVGRLVEDVDKGMDSCTGAIFLKLLVPLILLVKEYFVIHLDFLEVQFSYHPSYPLVCSP
jgi:ABC-type transport system involved in cytochrome bd biosynthesis fused ATPase/permease subunit